MTQLKPFTEILKFKIGDRVFQKSTSRILIVTGIAVNTNGPFYQYKIYCGVDEDKRGYYLSGQECQTFEQDAILILDKDMEDRLYILYGRKEGST